MDHDHNCCTGCPHCVRGLLCRPCNTDLGRCEKRLRQHRRRCAYRRWTPTWQVRPPEVITRACVIRTTSDGRGSGIRASRGHSDLGPPPVDRRLRARVRRAEASADCCSGSGPREGGAPGRHPENRSGADPGS
ncbi:endonuclease domain-containing protein [Streptomyces sp. NPDC006464]|uniref:endonuclease domain-containing protein n=1 Tax=Streptomyces sp. NPDC006464 TaxID=3154305 RepID=UPI0033A4C1B0